MSTTKTKPTKQAIIEVLTAAPEATVAQIAVSAGVGRSTAGKMLAQMESEGEVRRTEGGRESSRRLPDLWSLVAEQPATATGESAKAPAADEPAGGKGNAASASQPVDGKLKPGGLDPLVMDYLNDNADSGPHGSTEIAKALQRSSGAVGNCLVRLTDAKKVKLVNEKPRRYSLA